MKTYLSPLLFALLVILVVSGAIASLRQDLQQILTYQFVQEITR